MLKVDEIFKRGLTFVDGAGFHPEGKLLVNNKSSLLNSISRSIKFFCDDVVGASQLNFIPELATKIPYRECWFEFLFPQGDRSGFLAITTDNGVLFFSFFWSAENTKCGWGFFGSFFIRDNGAISYAKAPCSAEDFIIETSPLFSFISALNCKNVILESRAPNQKAQRLRASLRKPPLFSYHTLVLDIERSAAKSDHLGGTHSSPRVHLRRGHPRQYAPEKWTWVQPCAVGNKSKGIVHKDYAVLFERGRT